MSVKMKVVSTPFAAIARAGGLFADDMAEFAANDIADEADRLILHTTKTGHFYSGNRVRSSAPGEPPASQTGSLIRSRIVRGRGRVWRVTYTADHASWLEYGTRTMAPRPFLRRAMRNISNRRANRVRWAQRAGRRRFRLWWRS